MINFALNNTNDIYLDKNNNLAVVNNIDAVAQTIRETLKLWLGEYDFDITLGMPYNSILGNPTIDNSKVTYFLNKNINTINKYISQTDLPTLGIKKVVSVKYNLDKIHRKMNIQITIILNSNTSIEVNL